MTRQKIVEHQTEGIGGSGPDANVAEALRAAGRFGLKAKEALGEVEDTVARWRAIAQEPGIGMTAAEAEQFADAFEDPERKAVQKARATVSGVASLPSLPCRRRRSRPGPRPQGPR